MTPSIWQILIIILIVGGVLYFLFKIFQSFFKKNKK
tara:strand:+ start:697 stop:804 length:108 start_codon:yes stop_codon:yes gene_type:complete